MSDLPGFTPEQAWTIETVAQRAAERAVAEFAAQPCNSPCQRVSDIQDTVYGNGTPGLKITVTQLKQDCEGLHHDIEGLVWWGRLVASAVVVALVSSVITLLR